MNNVLLTVKRFLSNKNTVTIIGVLLAIVVLYVGYNYRVKQEISPISVPYAKKEISSRTLITEDMIGTMTIPKSMVNGSNIVTNINQVINKYVSYGSTIPEGGLFYKSQLMTEEEMPDSAFADIKDGYTIFSLGVDLQTTYGNSIFPGNTIDLFFKATDDTGKIIFGKMIKSIEVLAVKDQSGNPVFESTVETRVPSTILFAVPDDMYLLLMKASYIGSVKILPVPRNKDYSANPGEASVSSEFIREFILSKTASIPDEEILANTTTLPTE